MNGQPLPAFGFESFASVGINEIISAAAAGIGLFPLGIDQAVTFEPMQNGIKHAIAPFKLAAGKFAHFLDDFVAITFASARMERTSGFEEAATKSFASMADLYIDQPHMSTEEIQNSGGASLAQSR